MKKKLTVSTMALAFKLLDIQRHLRDCTEDIIAFSKFLASRLDFIRKPDMRPWDFVHDWGDAINARHFELFSDFGGIDEYRDPEGMRRNIRLQVALDCINKMMPIFAEDLCGKEFAEVAEMFRDGMLQEKVESMRQFKENYERDSRFDCKFSFLSNLPRFPMISDRQVMEMARRRADDIGADFLITLKRNEAKNLSLAEWLLSNGGQVIIDEKAAQHSKGVAHELVYLREMREETGTVIHNPCHPFPPGKPVMEEDVCARLDSQGTMEDGATREIDHRFDHQLSRDEDLPYLE